MAIAWTLLADLLRFIAAGGATILALWMATHRRGSDPAAMQTAFALGLSGLWAVGSFAFAPTSVIYATLVSASYLAWLWALYRYFAHDERDKSAGPVRAVVYALGFVELLQLALIAARTHYAGEPQVQDIIIGFEIVFRLLFCSGALVLVHNLYAGAGPPARQGLRWPAAALAVSWLYDLNLYTIVYLAGVTPLWLVDLRSLAVVAMVLLLGYGALRQETDLRFRPSRSFTFRSFSLLVIGAYLGVMVLIGQTIALTGSDFARFIQVSFVTLASVLALAFLPSKRLRGWLRVTLSKHLFQHRYDYRAEWLRFTDTIGRAGPQAAPLPERAVQAVADITDSPRGALLTPREEGGMSLDARWQWDDIEVPAVALSESGLRFFERSQYILDLDDLRGGRASDIPHEAAPQWLMHNHEAWALVPLLHFERLVGIVVLARPITARRLDWEDFDLLRVIGRQLASYLAEQGSQNALGEAQRFEEFNRRIAFVMHDIKNLASQLSLLAANAEKHAAKPAFRADMILTLRNSTDKLQALLNRLGRYGQQGAGSTAEVELDEVIGRVAAQFADRHEIIAPERGNCLIRGDGEGIEQALVHLVQNAIEASRPGTPVFIDLRRDATSAIVEVIDSGCGMSAEFIRTRLFKPFHSSKPGGFGIGAFEARELVRASGGRLDVESREGMGTRFLIRLPLASAAGLIDSFKTASGNSTEAA